MQKTRSKSTDHVHVGWLPTGCDRSVEGIAFKFFKSNRLRTWPLVSHTVVPNGLEHDIRRPKVRPL